MIGNQIAGYLSAGAPPIPPTNFESISTVTVGGSAVSSITFSSIPSTYKHLQIRGMILTSGGTNPDYYFNSDTTSGNYKGHHLWGNGSSAFSNDYFAFNYNPSSSYPSAFVMDILDYASTNKNKTTRTLAGSDTNGGTSEIALWSGLWMNNTTAISSITLRGNGANFTQYSSFALYGITGA